jgi:hypothetical protein
MTSSYGDLDFVVFILDVDKAAGMVRVLVVPYVPAFVFDLYWKPLGLALLE